MPNNDMTFEIPMNVEVEQDSIPMSIDHSLNDLSMTLGATVNPNITYSSLEDVTASVDRWLEENVNPQTGYVVDKTLRIENAAADAKATGNAIAEKMPVVEFGEKSLVINTTTVNFSKDGDNDWYISGDDPLSGFTTNSYLVDVLYTVTWDGIPYECFYERHTHRAAENAVRTQKVIGNMQPIGFDSTYYSNAPFCIVYGYPNSYAHVKIYAFNSTATTHTIKIESTPFTKTIIPGQYYIPSNYGVPYIAHGSGDRSVIEGCAATASGECAHAEGNACVASGNESHAEGTACVASGNHAHAEGRGTIASGYASHTEGSYTEASSSVAHAEGYHTLASESRAHAEGNYTTASGAMSHAEGHATIANHRSQHVFGEYNIEDPSVEASDTYGTYIEIVGNGTATDARSNARTLDWNGNETLSGTLMLGSDPVNSMDAVTKHYVDDRIFFDRGSAGRFSIVQNGTGVDNDATGDLAIALGSKSQATGMASFAMGVQIRIGDDRYPTIASGQRSVSMGGGTKATGSSSQAFGELTEAKGIASTAFGDYSIASGRSSFVIGQANIEDTNAVDTSHGSGARKYLFMIGNGVDSSNRSNALTVDWDGNEWLAGSLTIGSTTITEQQLIRLLALLN